MWWTLAEVNWPETLVGHVTGVQAHARERLGSVHAMFVGRGYAGFVGSWQ